MALLARALLAAIWPSRSFRAVTKRLANDPRLREPKRKRRMQMVAFDLS